MLYHKCNQGIFNQPVDPARLNIPTYNRVIKKPMDLGTVRQKLDAGEYENIDDFADDVRLTFENARKFNPDKHPVHAKATVLLQYFEDIYMKAKTKFVQTQKQMRIHSCELCYEGKVCNYCLRKCVPLDAPVILCDLCHGRIPHRSYYYRVNGCTQSWCAKCFVKSGTSSRVYKWFETAEENEANSVQIVNEQEIKDDPQSPRKKAAKLVKRNPESCECYNGVVCSEAWVQCSVCESHFHQACALHDPWNSKSVFVCMTCRPKHKEVETVDEEVEEEDRIDTADDDDDDDIDNNEDGETLPNAKDLPCTALADYIEERICRTIHEEYLSRGDTSETAAHVSGKFTFREVSRLERTLNITEEARRAIRLVAPHYGEDAYPSKVDYESRVFVLFEKIDGVDVLL